MSGVLRCGVSVLCCRLMCVCCVGCCMVFRIGVRVVIVVFELCLC